MAQIAVDAAETVAAIAAAEAETVADGVDLAVDETVAQIDRQTAADLTRKRPSRPPFRRRLKRAMTTICRELASARSGSFATADK